MQNTKKRAKVFLRIRKGSLGPSTALPKPLQKATENTAISAGAQAAHQQESATT